MISREIIVPIISSLVGGILALVGSFGATTLMGENQFERDLLKDKRAIYGELIGLLTPMQTRELSTLALSACKMTKSKPLGLPKLEAKIGQAMLFADEDLLEVLGEFLIFLRGNFSFSSKVLEGKAAARAEKVGKSPEMEAEQAIRANLFLMGYGFESCTTKLPLIKELHKKNEQPDERGSWHKINIDLM